MLHEIFRGIFDQGQNIAVEQFLLCLLVSLLTGTFLAVVYTYKNQYTQSFVITLALIPAIVCVVILLVNGNVAVAGAFNLVRFRSVPGSAKEICAIFLAMGTGMTAGMGYLGYAVLFAVVLAGGNLCYTYFGFGISRQADRNKTLHITIPENLDYTHVFDELLNCYARKWTLVSVKTTNMGSLYKLIYQITLKDLEKEKEFIDELRCRNGNLEITVSRQETISYEL